MQINNPDALKGWLTIILEPLCDADPPALARYVLALLKKDKPQEDLSKCMAEQLDVFLGAETQTFLERLFNVIQTEEYMNPVAGEAIADGQERVTSLAIDAAIEPAIVTPSSSSSSDLLANKENHENTPPLVQTKEIQSMTTTSTTMKKLIEAPSKSTAIVAANACAAITTNVVQNSVKIGQRRSHDPSPVKEKADGNVVQNKDGRRRRTSLRSRSRSRSRSYDRSRRSRSRERRNNEREKVNHMNHRQFRNKSPIAAAGGGNRGPMMRYNNRRNNNADRSPRPHPYGRLQQQHLNSASRSRSGSPQDRRKIARSMSPGNDDGAPAAKRMRCRDFDEKGYCMRGETCPWDHGVDPVVLEDINSPTLITSMGSGANIRGGSMHSEYSPDAPDLWNRNGSGGFMGGPRAGLPHRQGGNANSGGAYPRGPGGSQFRGVPPFPFPGLTPSAGTPLQRELIPVPVVDGGSNSNEMMMGQGKRRFEPEDAVAIADGQSRRKMPLNSRLGPRPQQNCSLELRKVPKGLNTIAHLNNHFSKFGKIYNIQIAFDGDTEAAIITFSTHAEANVAYRSTEAVLNNRFIKVFWHSSAGTIGPGGAAMETPTPINSAAAAAHKEESQSRRIFTSQHTLSNVPAAPIPSSTAEVDKDAEISSSTSTVTAGTTAVATTSIISTAVQSMMSSTNVAGQTAAQIRLQNSRITRATNELIRKKKEEQRNKAVQIAQGLHKRKHDLLQKYLKQMKSAVELIEKVEHSDPKRAKMITTVKELQESIDKLRKEITTEQVEITAQISQTPQTGVKKSKEQQQKELLDMELELITQQQEGNDTTELQKRLFELQRTYGATPTARPHFAPRPARVRPAPPGSTSVDRRPTTITIVGFSLDESDALLGHFKHFGEITKNQLDQTVPSLTISYATRLNAEQAMQRGRFFKDKMIQMTWFNAAAPHQQQKIEQQTIIAETTESIETASTEDQLTMEDEEEEEDAESEDRSWRR